MRMMRFGPLGMAICAAGTLEAAIATPQILDRGTEEYNRSLGERRAQSVREYLARLGMDPSMIQTITLGEERPAVPGHDEAAWSKNRRGEIILLTPPTGTGQGGTR